jgi:DNA-binding NarL/FixJ family response regulator
MMPRERLTDKEIQVASLVWQGLTNREISKLMGTTEQVIKNHLRSTFDKLVARAGMRHPKTRFSRWAERQRARNASSGQPASRLL